LFTFKREREIDELHLVVVVFRMVVRAVFGIQRKQHLIPQHIYHRSIHLPMLHEQCKQMMC